MNALVKSKDSSPTKIRKTSKVTAQCQMLHGTIFDADSTEAYTYLPPLHFRCQSALLSVTILDKYNDLII
jgi:SPP1 gp7 family putative phage head morphogenesis protein